MAWLNSQLETINFEHTTGTIPDKDRVCFNFIGSVCLDDFVHHS